MPNCLGKGLGATGCSSQVRTRRLFGGLVGRQSTVSAAHLPTTNLAPATSSCREGSSSTGGHPCSTRRAGQPGQPGTFRGILAWATHLGTLGSLRLPGQHLRSHAMQRAPTAIPLLEKPGVATPHFGRPVCCLGTITTFRGG